MLTKCGWARQLKEQTPGTDDQEKLSKGGNLQVTQQDVLICLLSEGNIVSGFENTITEAV